ncbi:D-alanine transaminase [Bacillus mesophilus]|uniref:Amino acid aminotransferase n=1 Tax=Bacillus mesophilus TaxID=1808955 RepID=A0A6M0QF15_9BACI|nr:aminotransferase class IV [Bacillus mesophilus]MBM7663203.1 D-alanine transaminase [Bacillus mesophilus]NEY73958.1 amino acid aminotransferase [Bacillus mesophilus]
MEIAYYKDQFLTDVNEGIVPIQERGHQFGDGIYEVVRVYNKKPFMLEDHLDRFELSANAISLTLPHTREQLKEIILEGIRRSGEDSVDVYFQVTRGIAPRLHLYPDTPAVLSMVVKPSKSLDESKKRNGIAVLLMDDERWANCYIKSLNLLPNVMAKQAAVQKGCDEAILVKEGYVTEGSSSNLFVVKNGTLYTTPATKQILHGITRKAVFTLAERLNILVKEEKFTPEFLLNADEAFITSTTSEVLPINKVDEHNLPTHFSITHQLQNEFSTLY